METKQRCWWLASERPKQNKTGLQHVRALEGQSKATTLENIHDEAVEQHRRVATALLGEIHSRPAKRLTFWVGGEDYSSVCPTKNVGSQLPLQIK